MRIKKIVFLPFMALSLSIGGCDKSVGVSTSSNKRKDNVIDDYIELMELKLEGATDLIIGNIKAGKYAPGEELTFKIESVTDITFYAYLNNEKLASTGYDGDYNAIYSFTMPSQNSVLAIGWNYYIDRNYTLNEITNYPRVSSLDEIKSVSIIKGTIGTSSNNEIKLESTDERDISYNYHFCFEEPFRKVNSTESSGGGTYVHLIFKMEYSSISIEIENGTVCYRDFVNYQLFEYANENHNEPKIEYPDDLGA